MEKFKYFFALFMIIGLLSFTLTSPINSEQQIKNEPTDDIEQGFYMNYGCTKVDSITCYGYDGL
ncbi:MAG: hypothetical protein WEA99_01975 [Brumimicrobium sp.]